MVEILFKYFYHEIKLTKKSSLIDFEKLWVPFWDLLRRLVFGIVDVIFGRRGIVFVFSKNMIKLIN